MAEEFFQRPLLSFDMQGQSIKDVLLKSVKIEEVEVLPEASDNYNRVLFNKGEIKYSNGEKWIGQAEMVGLGLVVKTNFNDSSIPKGQIDINGHRVTLFNKIDNSDLALMPTKTIKGNRTDSNASPTDITYDNLAKDMRDSTLLGVTLTNSSGVYILSQGDVEIGRFSTEKFVDDIKLVSGTWLKKGTKFKEDESGTNLALKLIIKKEFEEDSFIYLDVSKLMDIYIGGESDTINIVVKQTEEGYKIFAKIKENSIKKEHLSTELYAEIEGAISSAQIQADWNQTDATQKDFIKNKPTLSLVATSGSYNDLKDLPAETQADWNETDESSPSFIQNKPTINTPPIVDSLPETGVDGEQVIFKDRTYTWYNGKWNSIADDLGGREEAFEEEFVFQPTANDLSVKDGYAKIKKIKGRSIVWNQIFPDINKWTNAGAYGTNASKNGTYCSMSIADDRYFRIEWKNNPPTGSYIWAHYNTNITALNNRIQPIPTKMYYLIKAKVNAPCRIGVGHYFAALKRTWNVDESNVDKWIVYEDIITVSSQTASADVTNDFGVIVSPIEKNVIVDFEVIKAVNLSRVFIEPALINNISLEKINVLLPKLKTYNYILGQTLSTNIKGICCTGFNQFDGEKAKVIAYQTYYLGGDYTSLRYVGDVEECDIKLSEDRLYTPLHDGYIYATGSNICINISHSGYRNGQYEEYEKSIREINSGLALSEVRGKLNGVGDSVVIFPNGLRSAGTAYDEITSTRAIKRIKEVLLSDLEWSLVETNGNAKYCYTAHINDLKSKTEGVSSLITDFKCTANATEVIYDESLPVTNKNKIGTSIIKQVGKTIVVFTTQNTIEQYLTYIENKTLLYETDTPEEYVLDTPLNLEYAVYDFGTEEIIADQEDKNVPIVPLRAEIQYGFNAVDEIRNNRFSINDLKEKVQELSDNGGGNNPLTIIAGDETLVEYYPSESATLELAKVASSGSYKDLSDKPTISNAEITVTNGAGEREFSFSLNQSDSKTVTFSTMVRQYVADKLIGAGGIITLDKHKCGVSPMVQAYLNGTQVLCEISNDGKGNISWASNIKLTEDSNFKLVIIGNPNESTKLI